MPSKRTQKKTKTTTKTAGEGERRFEQLYHKKSQLAADLRDENSKLQAELALLKQHARKSKKEKSSTKKGPNPVFELQARRFTVMNHFYVGNVSSFISIVASSIEDTTQADKPTKSKAQPNPRDFASDDDSSGSDSESDKSSDDDTDSDSDDSVIEVAPKIATNLALLHKLALEFRAMLSESVLKAVRRDQGTFISLFKKVQTNLRSQLAFRVKGCVANIFGPEIYKEYQSENRGDKLKKLIGWKGGKNYTALCPLLWGEEDLVLSSNIFKADTLIRILKCCITGPSSITKRKGVKSYAKIWKITEVTPGAIAFAAILARYVLGGDSEFGEKGNVTGISWIDDFNRYCTLINKMRSAPEGTALLKHWNDNLLPHKAKDLSADGNDEDYEGFLRRLEHEAHERQKGDSYAAWLKAAENDGHKQKNQPRPPLVENVGAAEQWPARRYRLSSHSPSRENEPQPATPPRDRHDPSLLETPRLQTFSPFSFSPRPELQGQQSHGNNRNTTEAPPPPFPPNYAITPARFSSGIVEEDPDSFLEPGDDGKVAGHANNDCSDEDFSAFANRYTTLPPEEPPSANPSSTAAPNVGADSCNHGEMQTVKPRPKAKIVRTRKDPPDAGNMEAQEPPRKRLALPTTPTAGDENRNLIDHQPQTLEAPSPCAIPPKKKKKGGRR